MGIVTKMQEMSRSEDVQPRLRHFHKTLENLGLMKSLKAVRYLETEMSVEKGFSRHDGQSYYVHPIAVAQTALDFGLVNQMISRGEHEKADALIVTCLLHDAIEDIEGDVESYIAENYGGYILQNVKNVTKVSGESFEDYLVRVVSMELSSLVKILDQLNNISTMSKSSLAHREKHTKIAREYYIPLIKLLRQRDYEYGRFYFQVRTIITSLVNEIERGVHYEREYEKVVAELKEKVQE